MVEPSPKERIEELLAGEILDNLSPEETEEWKQLVAENPELVKQSDRLRSVIELMPYGLPSMEPPSQLRSTILDAVSDNNKQNTTQARSSRWRWSPVVATVAAILALVLGIDNYRLRQNLNLVRVQLSEHHSPFRDNSSRKMAIAKDVILANHWDGISELVGDHTGSLSRSRGPADVKLSTPEKVAEHFQEQITLPSPLPQFVRKGSELLGGSLCQLGNSKGIRFSYQLSTGETISFYQLSRHKQSLFPHSGLGYLYITQPQEPNIVIWEDEKFIYAIVATLPFDKLQQLTSNIKVI